MTNPKNEDILYNISKNNFAKNNLIAIHFGYIFLRNY